VTTAGMAEGEMKEIAGLIARAVRDESATKSVAEAVRSLVSQFPAYGEAAGLADATKSGSTGG
jgi:glycine hydroxymethyltransferase